MPEPTALPPAPTSLVTAPQPFSAGPHILPTLDLMELLPAAAADKLHALRQRAADAHAIVPEFETVREASMERIEAENALKRLTDHPQDHGFGRRPDDPLVRKAQIVLAKATADFKRLQELQTARTAAWQSSSQALAACEEWLRSGRPGGTALEVVEVEPPRLLKGEDVLAALERVRRRGRELKADLARIAAAPFPSSHARAKVRAEVEALAAQGAVVVSDVLEHDRKIIWPTSRIQSQVLNAQPGAVAFAEPPDTLALMAWLHKDALIPALDREIAAESDDAAALSASDRELRTAEVMGDLLAVERDEAALVWTAQAQGLPVEHRSDINPLALLGVRLITDAPITLAEMRAMFRDLAWLRSVNGCAYVSPERAEALLKRCNNLRSSAISTALARSTGGGFGDAQTNALVEGAAVRKVIRILKQRGFKVRSRESERIGYDLDATKGRTELHVEVKGVTGDGVQFLITQRAKAASDLSYRLMVVTSARTRSARVQEFHGTGGPR